MTAYLVLDFTILDLPGFRPYIDGVPTFIARHGGRYIVRGVEPQVMEGDWSPQRVVILEFPAAENARAFLDDPEFQSLKAVRERTTVSKLILVEGCI